MLTFPSKKLMGGVNKEKLLIVNENAGGLQNFCTTHESRFKML